MQSLTVEALESRHHLAATVIDTSFGTNGTAFAQTGRITAAFGAPSGAKVLCQAVMPDGRIVVAGLVKSTSDLCIARLLANGQLDTTFGGDGILDNVPLEFLNDVAVAPNGDVLVLGHEVDSDFRLIRYLASGTQDLGFAGSGIADPYISLDGTASVALAPDGSIYTVGSRTSSPVEDPAAPGYLFQLSRMGRDGYLDITFGYEGWAYYGWGDGVPNFGGIDVQIDSQGRPIVLTTNGAIARFTEWGQPDLTFGPRGLATLPWPTSAQVRAFDVATDGGILVVGDPTESSDRRTFVTKITSHGIADSSIEGTVAAFGSEYIQFRDVEQDQNGAIYLAGTLNSQQIAMRLLSSGKVDRSFGRNGGLVVPLPNTSGAYTYGDALSIDRRGGLLLAGVYAGTGNAHGSSPCEIPVSPRGKRGSLLQSSLECPTDPIGFRRERRGTRSAMKRGYDSRLPSFGLRSRRRSSSIR